MKVKIGSYDFSATTLSNLSSIYANSRKLKITNNGTDYYVPLAWSVAMVKEGNDYINTKVIFQNGNNYYYPIKTAPRVTLSYNFWYEKETITYYSTYDRDHPATKYSSAVPGKGYQNPLGAQISQEAYLGVTGYQFNEEAIGNTYLFIFETSDYITFNYNPGWKFSCWWEASGRSTLNNPYVLAFILTANDNKYHDFLAFSQGKGKLWDINAKLYYPDDEINVYAYQIDQWRSYGDFVYEVGWKHTAVLEGKGFPPSPFAKVSEPAYGHYGSLLSFSYSSVLWNYLTYTPNNNNNNNLAFFDFGYKLNEDKDDRRYDIVNVGYAQNCSNCLSKTKLKYVFTKTITKKAVRENNYSQKISQESSPEVSTDYPNSEGKVIIGL